MSLTPTPNIGIGQAVAVSINGTLAFVKSGSIERKAVLVKVTNARSAGYQQFKAGIKGAEFSAELVYNGDAPLSIIEGTEIPVIFDSVGYETTESLEVAMTTPTGRLITLQVVISSVKDAWEVEGDYGVTIAGSSTGAYTVVDTASGATAST